MRSPDKETVATPHQRMSGWIVRIAALAQRTYELSLVMLNRLRRRFLLPMAQWGGRDMLLLRNGVWIDGHSTVAPAQVAARYDAEGHTVRPAADVSGGRSVRWGWVEAIQGARDMSEWFAGLRLHGGATLEPRDALMLYAHQNAWVPDLGEPVRVVTRRGVEETVHLTPQPAPAATHEEVMRRVNSIDGIR